MRACTCACRIGRPSSTFLHLAHSRMGIGMTHSHGDTRHGSHACGMHTEDTSPHSCTGVALEAPPTMSVPSSRHPGSAHCHASNQPLGLLGPRGSLWLLGGSLCARHPAPNFLSPSGEWGQVGVGETGHLGLRKWVASGQGQVSSLESGCLPWRAGSSAGSDMGLPPTWPQDPTGPPPAHLGSAGKGVVPSGCSGTSPLTPPFFQWDSGPPISCSLGCLSHHLPPPGSPSCPGAHRGVAPPTAVLPVEQLFR